VNTRRNVTPEENPRAGAPEADVGLVNGATVLVRVDTRSGMERNLPPIHSGYADFRATRTYAKLLPTRSPTHLSTCLARDGFPGCGSARSQPGREPRRTAREEVEHRPELSTS